MHLSERDRRSLAEIERAIRAEDPAFADRMTSSRRRGRVMRLAQRWLSFLVRPWSRWASPVLIPLGLVLLVLGSVHPNVAVTVCGSVVVVVGTAWTSAAWILRGRGRPRAG